MLKHLEQRRRDEEGFTLIELMVVVLILGILMAIAIPTFLSTTNGAKNSAAESNATNAITNEMAYYSSNQQFTATGSSLDPSLPWTTTQGTKGDVYVAVGCTTTAGKESTMAGCTAPAVPQAVLVQAVADNGDCYTYFADESATPAPLIGYNFDTTCNSAPDFSTTPPTQGHAAQNSGTTWYTSW